MDLSNIGLEGVDWIHLAQYMDHWRDVNEQSNEPLGSRKVCEFLD